MKVMSSKKWRRRRVTENHYQQINLKNDVKKNIAWWRQFRHFLFTLSPDSLLSSKGICLLQIQRKLKFFIPWKVTKTTEMSHWVCPSTLHFYLTLLKVLLSKSMEKHHHFRFKNSKKDQVEDILLLFKVNRIKNSQSEKPRSERL